MSAGLIRGIVLSGDKTGRTIGFPTINLDPTLLSPEARSGIYASEVYIQGKKHIGALYFGPRLVKGETQNVLEIHILDFTEDIYGETIEFELKKHIRDIENFNSLEELKKAIAQDVAEVRAFFLPH